MQLTGEVTSPDEFGDLIVRAQGGSLVRIRDVAHVSLQYARDRSTIFRLNGKNSLAISVTKRTGANIINLVDQAKQAVQEMQPTWPRGTEVSYTFDQSVQIRRMVNELQDHIILGMLFVLCLLSFFLGLRNSIFISTAIPFSMMMGALVLSAMGITLNMVVLFSSVIALGMLVDDGIVVVENIYRHLQMGKDRVTAAIDGTRKVMVPVTTATITTIAAFMPIVFMPGFMGQFMKYLPITVSVMLVGSLFVAFVFNPVFASLFMTGHSKRMEEAESGWFERFRNWYRRRLEGMVDHPWRVLAFCFLFVVGGIFAYGALGTGVTFFPNIEPQVVAAEITGPLGIDIGTTDSALKIIESKLFQIPKDSSDVENFSAVVGFNKVDQGGGDRRPESHYGYVDVSFVDYDHRKVDSWKSMQWMQDNIPQVLPGWKVAVKKLQDGPPTGYPVSFEISGASGSDFDHLSEIADTVKARLATVPGLININWDYDPVRPEMAVDVDREQAQRLGLSTSDVAMAVRGSIHGYEAGKFRVGKDEDDVMIRLDPEGARSIFQRRIRSSSRTKARKFP